MKKLLSIVLSIVMVLGMVMPMGVMAEETVEKDWIEFEGNSTIFMPYDTTEGSTYSDRVNLTGYLPGLDYGATVSSPSGVFATDKGKIYGNGEKMGAFVYTKDSTTEPDRYTVADFKTGADGKLYWNIEGVDYLVNPDQKAIKLVKNVATTTISYSTLENKDELATKYQSLDKFVLDVEDGRYESISFLAGMVNSYSRKLYVELEYDNKIERKEIDVVGTAPSSKRTYKNGSTYFHRMNSATVENATTDYHTFNPYTVEVDKNATLKRVVLLPTALTATGASGGSYHYPIYIISAWRDMRTQEEVFADLDAYASAGVKTEDALRAVKSALAFIDEKYEELTDAQQTIYNKAKSAADTGEVLVEKQKKLNEKYSPVEMKLMFDMFATNVDFSQSGWVGKNSTATSPNILAFKGHRNSTSSNGQPRSENGYAYRADELLGVEGFTHKDGRYNVTVNGIPFVLGEIARDAYQRGANAWMASATYTPSAYKGDIVLPVPPTEGDVIYADNTSNTKSGKFYVNKSNVKAVNIIAVDSTRTNTNLVAYTNKFYHVALKYEGEEEEKGYLTIGNPMQSAEDNYYAIKVADYDAIKATETTAAAKYESLIKGAVRLDTVMDNIDLTKLSAKNASKKFAIPTSSIPFTRLYTRQATWAGNYDSTFLQNVAYPVDASKKLEYIKILANLNVDLETLTTGSGGFYSSSSIAGNMMLAYNGQPTIKVGEDDYYVFMNVQRECTDGIFLGMTVENNITYAEKIGAVNAQIENLTTEATVEEFTAIEEKIAELKEECEYIEDSDFNLAKLNEIKRIINAELNAHNVIKVGKVTQFPLSAATGANSRLFVEKGKESTIAESGYIEGVDFYGRIADSKNAENQYFIPFSYYDGTNTQNGLIFKKDEKGSYVEFTYYGGETKKFYVNPEEKVIKVTKVDAKEEYYGANVAAAATLNETTIDVPDGKYDSISYVAGSTYQRVPEITFIYEDEEVPATNVEMIVEWSHVNYRGAKDTDSYKYYTTWNDTTMAQRSVAHFYFVSDLTASTAYIGYKEFTVAPDPTKVLKAIKFSENVYGSPITIISLWGSNKTIEEKLAEFDAIEITNAQELAAAKQKIADFDAYLAELGYELIDLAGYKAPYTALQTRIAEFEANAERVENLNKRKYTYLEFAKDRDVFAAYHDIADLARFQKSSADSKKSIAAGFNTSKYTHTDASGNEVEIFEWLPHVRADGVTPVTGQEKYYYKGMVTYSSSADRNSLNEYAKGKATSASYIYIADDLIKENGEELNEMRVNSSSSSSTHSSKDYYDGTLKRVAAKRTVKNPNFVQRIDEDGYVIIKNNEAQHKIGPVSMDDIKLNAMTLPAKNGTIDAKNTKGTSLDLLITTTGINTNTGYRTSNPDATKGQTGKLATGDSPAAALQQIVINYADGTAELRKLLVSNNASWNGAILDNVAYRTIVYAPKKDSEGKDIVYDGDSFFLEYDKNSFTRLTADKLATVGLTADGLNSDTVKFKNPSVIYSDVATVAQMVCNRQDTVGSNYRNYTCLGSIGLKNKEVASIELVTNIHAAVEDPTAIVVNTDPALKDSKGNNYDPSIALLPVTIEGASEDYVYFAYLGRVSNESALLAATIMDTSAQEKIDAAEAAMAEITVDSSLEEAKKAYEIYSDALTHELIRAEDFDSAIVTTFNAVYNVIREKAEVAGRMEVVYYQGDAPTVKVEINNKATLAGKPYSVILAYYDEAGNYIASHISNRTSTANEVEEFTITDESCPANTMKVKAFLWKDFKTLIPLANAADSEVRSTLKVLAIGNSYSDDAQTYLAEIAKNAGIEEIVIGNAYIGGCSLSTHNNNAAANKTAYWFRLKKMNEEGEIIKTSSGTKVEGSTSTLADKTLLECITAEDWDIITIQQASASSGKPETFGPLQNIIDYVNEHKTNKDAKIGWHMTWAYTDNSTTLAERYPGMTQMDLYNAISGAVQTEVLPLEDISFVIPAGTAVQNARATSLGDTLIGSDNVHLNELGDYVAGLTWFAKLTGMSIDGIDFVPNGITKISDNLDIIKKAVKDALANPYTVTK